MKPINLSPEAPWRQRFTADSIFWAEIAPQNPDRGLVATNRTGIVQIYAWDVAAGELRQLTDRERGTPGATIGADGRHAYFLDDERGNEIGHYARLPLTGGPAEDITPDLPPYNSFGLTASAGGGRLAFMAAGPEGFQVYSAPLAADHAIGPWQVIWRGTALALGPTLSHDGDLAVVESTEGIGKLEAFFEAVDTTSGSVIARLVEPGANLSAAAFAPLPGDGRLLATSSASGFNRPFLWDPRRGTRKEIDLPGIEGDIRPAGWSPDGRRLLLTQVFQAKTTLLVADLDSGRVDRLDHPAGTLSSARFTAGGEIFSVWQDAAHPARLIALDGQTGRQTRTVLAPGQVPPGRPWRSVTFPSTDDVTIQGWLGVPEGAGPFPVILETHGGPTAVMTEVFSPSAQAWLDHGFAFLSINYRGSTTFGKAFEESIWGRLGSVEIDDMAAARDWLVGEGIADPEKILLTGGSYGGYLTLQALGRRPELWAGGMAAVAIADWTLMYEDLAETLRGYMRAMFGGTPEEKPEAMRAASPLTYVDRVRAPILVIQGRNDTRCPSRQMEIYENRLKTRGGEIEVHWFDAGHGSYENEQRIAFMERMLRFAYRVLG